MVLLSLSQMGVGILVKPEWERKAIATWWSHNGIVHGCLSSHGWSYIIFSYWNNFMAYSPHLFQKTNMWNLSVLGAFSGLNICQTLTFLFRESEERVWKRTPSSIGFAPPLSKPSRALVMSPACDDRGNVAGSKKAIFISNLKFFPCPFQLNLRPCYMAGYISVIILL